MHLCPAASGPAFRVLWIVPLLAALCLGSLPARATGESERFQDALAADTVNVETNIRAVMIPFAGGLVVPDTGLNWAIEAATSCYDKIKGMPRYHAALDMCVAIDIALAQWVQDLQDQRPDLYAKRMTVSAAEFGNAALGRVLGNLQQSGLGADDAYKRAQQLGGIGTRELWQQVQAILARRRGGKPE